MTCEIRPQRFGERHRFRRRSHCINGPPCQPETPHELTFGQRIVIPQHQPAERADRSDGRRVSGYDIAHAELARHDATGTETGEGAIGPP